MFKNIFLTLCTLMLISLIEAPHALSQVKTWEGTYCNKESTICIEFSKQATKWDKDFVIATITSKNKTVLIDEMELLLDDEGTYYTGVEIFISDNFKTITVKKSQYAGPVEIFDAEILVGNYVKIIP